MPIVASIGGNTGNQTMAIMIRALGGDQVRGSSARDCFTRNSSSAC